MPITYYNISKVRTLKVLKHWALIYYLKGKAISLPWKGAPKRLSTLIGFGFNLKHLTYQGLSLLNPSVSNNFFTILVLGQWYNIPLLTLQTNKLERSSLPSHHSLAKCFWVKQGAYPKLEGLILVH